MALRNPQSVSVCLCRCSSQCWEVPWISPPGPGWSVRTFAGTLNICAVKQSHWEGEHKDELFCPCRCVWREKMSTSSGVSVCLSIIFFKHLPSLWCHVTFVCLCRSDFCLIDRALLYSIETMVIQWCGLMGSVLQRDSSKLLHQGDHPGPTVELSFWTKQKENLLGIQKQVEIKSISVCMLLYINVLTSEFRI